MDPRQRPAHRRHEAQAYPDRRQAQGGARRALRARQLQVTPSHSEYQAAAAFRPRAHACMQVGACSSCEGWLVSKAKATRCKQKAGAHLGHFCGEGECENSRVRERGYYGSLVTVCGLSTCWISSRQTPYTSRDWSICFCVHSAGTVALIQWGGTSGSGTALARPPRGRAEPRE